MRSVIWYLFNNYYYYYYYLLLLLSSYLEFLEVNILLNKSPPKPERKKKVKSPFKDENSFQRGNHLTVLSHHYT